MPNYHPASGAVDNNHNHHHHNSHNDLGGGGGDQDDDLQSVGYASSTAELESELFVARDEDGASLATAQMLNPPGHHHHLHSHGNDADDATRVVQEMHLALLYLLSNPEEFQRALSSSSRTHPPNGRPPFRGNGGATTLHEWNAEYEDAESSLAEDTTTDATPSVVSGYHSTTPLPFVVFCDDAEVVLPAAHTASQLFGVEQVTGMELEAAAGVPALSQLFVRWLALMPGGDHLNLIDPPGLTVMRIAGGRYRVTAAHRVVWTWMNEFPPPPSFTTLSSATGLEDATTEDYFSSPHEGGGGGDGEEALLSLRPDDSFVTASHGSTNSSSRPSSSSPRRGGSSGGGGGGSPPPPRALNEYHPPEGLLRPGDLVTLTIVDVFETDHQGKLLSYCPTFDNRRVLKTNAATETLRKSTAQLATLFGRAQKSTLARKLGFHATQIAVALKERVEEAVAARNHPKSSSGGGGPSPRTTSAAYPYPYQATTTTTTTNNHHAKVSPASRDSSSSSFSSSQNKQPSSSQEKSSVWEEKKESSNHSRKPSNGKISTKRDLRSS